MSVQAHDSQQIKTTSTKIKMESSSVSVLYDRISWGLGTRSSPLGAKPSPAQTIDA